MNKNKCKILIVILISFFLNSCQGAKDALQGKKRSKGADEFLVEKKNPLSMPPNYDKLPVPGATEKEIPRTETNSSDIKKLLNLEQQDQTDNKTSDGATNIESSILKKIK